MSKQNPYIWAIILITTMCWSASFYWTQIRPDNIRQECFKEAGLASQLAFNMSIEEHEETNTTAIYKDTFNTCLDRCGLKH